MFSGGGSSDGTKSNALSSYEFVNQAAVSNAMAAGKNIDWAKLAQQWIQMRDNSKCESESICNANTNKILDPNYNSLKFEEKGEADMDMDEEQIDDKTALKTEDKFPQTSSIHNNVSQPWFFNEGASQLVPHSTVSSQWSSWQNDCLSQPQFNKNKIANNRYTNPVAHIPSLLKITVPHPNELRVIPDIPNQPENSSNIIDATKRKRLPAWIREGLEKMEREKQKQLEKERQNKDVINSPIEEDVSPSNILIKPINSPNVVCDNIDEENTDIKETMVKTIANEETDVNLENNEEGGTCSRSVFKTYEQKLSDLMIVVRQTLTQLLLETTNEEISKVADETFKSFKSKASSVQVIHNCALSTITGKLGLAAYGDSSSEENSDDGDDEHDSSKKICHPESDRDSEEEIRNTIRLKRRAFVKIAEDIEERLKSAATREEEKLKYFSHQEEEEEKERNLKKKDRLSREPSSSSYSGQSVFKGYENDFGEISETNIQHSNGKRQKDRSNRKERTTRFSDNKDKYVALPTTAAIIANTNTTGNVGDNMKTLNNQHQNMPDVNGLLTNYANLGMTNVLNAADFALEKVLKLKTSASLEKKERCHGKDRNYTPPKKKQRSRSKSSSLTTPSSSSSSSDSNSSSTSRSSYNSKYNHRSAKKHKRDSSSDRKYKKLHKSHRSDRKCSSSNTKRDRKSTSSRNHRDKSSDSDDEYNRRRKRDSYHSRHSFHSRSYTSSRRDRGKSRSLSRSSYSSKNRRH